MCVCGVCVWGVGVCVCVWGVCVCVCVCVVCVCEGWVMNVLLKAVIQLQALVIIIIQWSSHVFVSGGRDVVSKVTAWSWST